MNMVQRDETVRKNRARFNFVDVIITALLLFALFVAAMNLFFTGKGEERLIFFKMSGEQTETLDMSDDSLSKGDAVYDLESGKLLGRLYENYVPGSGVAVLFCEIGSEDQRVWFCNDYASFQIKGMIFENVLVTDVRKVDDYGKNKE